MYQKAPPGTRYGRFPMDLDREFRRNYDSPPWTCKCPHNYPIRRVCEIAWPILVSAIVCWGCGTVLDYEDSVTADPITQFENMVVRRPFVVRKGIASAPQDHGLGRKATPVVLYEMIKLGIEAGLSAKDISQELGIDEGWVRDLGGI